ncbi:MAG: GMC oxidoreductase, partial [Beutenbergiaceae bacterium]
SGQWLQARRPYFSEHVGRFLVDDLEDPYSTPLGHPYLWIRGKQLGGRMHAYGRVLQRMTDLDFKAASRDGYGNDWPIEYADLVPWYERVEASTGVYGDDDGVPNVPASVYRGPGYLSRVEEYFRDKVAERWPERKVISWRVQAPFLDRVPPGVAAARATGRLTERTEAVVTQITIDDRTGLASGAVFRDRKTKQEHRVYADAVLVCGSTIESVRLLLNSGSAAHPDGLGNSSGLVGRYFMDQTMSVSFADAPQFPGVWDSGDNIPVDPLYGAPGGILIPRYENVGPDTEPFRRGIAFQGLGGRVPVPEGHPAMFGMGSFGEMLARYDNRVSLNPRRKDRWGVPIPHIDLTMGDNDRILLERSMTALREMIAEAGFRANFIGSMAGLEPERIWPDFNPAQRMIFKRGIKMAVALGAAIHECGGARMGDDPATSVVNRHNQVWDAPNVYVPDAASFVSVGTVGPTLTIMALAARASHHLADQLADGSLHRSVA